MRERKKANIIIIIASTSPIPTMIRIPRVPGFLILKLDINAIAVSITIPMKTTVRSKGIM